MSSNKETFHALVKRVCAEENVQLEYVVRTFIQVISDMNTKFEENLSTTTDNVPRIGLLPVTAVNVAGQTRQVTLTHSPSHSLSLTYLHSLTLTHSHSLTNTHSLTHSPTLTLSHSLSLTDTHSLTHSLTTHSLTHSLASPWSPGQASESPRSLSFKRLILLFLEKLDMNIFYSFFSMLCHSITASLPLVTNT